MELKDETIKKALECCLIGECEGCPISEFSDCYEKLKDEAMSLINRQQAENNKLELENEVLKDAKNQLENELCNERMNLEHILTENEQLQRNLSQCENGYSQELHLARCKLDELKNFCTSREEVVRELRAEIERLKNEIKAFDNFLKETDCSLKEIRDNAIKEFAERLKAKFYTWQDKNGNWIKYIPLGDIDNLLTEMVGEQNA